MNRAGRIRARVQLDFAEGTFVARYILLKKSKQGLGLLRAEINALKISNLYLSFALLLQGPKDHEEIPDIHSHLHAIGVGFAVVRSTAELDVRLWRNAHGRKCNDFQARKGSRSTQKSVFCPDASQPEHAGTPLSTKSLAAVRQKMSFR
jgi:hypothetical protein